MCRMEGRIAQLNESRAKPNVKYWRYRRIGHMMRRCREEVCYECGGRTHVNVGLVVERAT